MHGPRGPTQGCSQLVATFWRSHVTVTSSSPQCVRAFPIPPPFSIIYDQIDRRPHCTALGPGVGSGHETSARRATDFCHMTSPWQHCVSMRIIWQNGVTDTPTRTMWCTHPQLRSCQDNAKPACHRRARYKMEWIYTRTKVSGHGILELAQENRKKELQKALVLHF
jgi:hypothetical protein